MSTGMACTWIGVGSVKPRSVTACTSVSLRPNASNALDVYKRQVQYMYKQWAGLYEEGKQKLYVNRGFGFIGYPGRVGILPEITVIELSTGTGAQEKVG